VDKVPKKDCGS